MLKCKNSLEESNQFFMVLMILWFVMVKGGDNKRTDK